MVPLTEQQTSALLSILMMEKAKSDKIPIIWNKMKSEFGPQLILKRIEFFKLPIFEPTAIMMISILANTPGMIVLAMIDILEAWDKYKPEAINAGFICEKVYPFGFYSQKEFEKVWDKRKEKMNEGWNGLIVNK